MNYTNSTLIVEDNNNISEAIWTLIAIIILCGGYFCFCTPVKKNLKEDLNGVLNAHKLELNYVMN